MSIEAASGLKKVSSFGVLWILAVIYLKQLFRSQTFDRRHHQLIDHRETRSSGMSPPSAAAYAIVTAEFEMANIKAQCIYFRKAEIFIMLLASSRFQMRKVNICGIIFAPRSPRVDFSKHYCLYHEASIARYHRWYFCTPAPMMPLFTPRWPA